MLHRLWAVVCGMAVIAATVPAESPSRADVEAVAARFRAERQQATATGATARFPAAWLQRADDLASRAESARTAGLNAEALTLYRDARWQLPALPIQFPDHAGRIFGDPRLKHGHFVRAVAYSPDGLRLASASRDGTVRVRDVGSGRDLFVFLGHGADDVRAVAFSPDGKSIASSGGNTILIWDSQNGKVSATLKGHTGAISCLAYRPDGQRLSSGGEDRMIRIWDPASGRELSSLGPQNASIHALVYSPNGQLLASTSGDGRLSVFAVESKDRRQALGQDNHTSAAYAVAFTPDGQHIITGGADRRIVLIGAPGPAGEPIDRMGVRQREFYGHSEYVTAIAVSHDGRLLASGSRDASVRLWDVQTGRLERTFLGHTEEVAAVAWRPDDRQLASGSLDQSVRLWNFDPIDAQRTLAGHKGAVWSAAISPDGRRIASGGADRVVRVWDAATGRPVAALAGHSQTVTAVAFHPSEPLIASGSGDRTARVWNLATGQAVRTLEGHEAPVLTVAFSPSGKVLATGGADRTVRLWDPSTGQALGVLAGPTAAVAAIAYRPDGAQLAAAAADGTIRIWNTADGKEELNFRAHESGGVAAVAYAPDGQRLATCGGDKQIRIWNLQSRPIREPLFRLLGHSGPLLALAFSPKGQFLATGGADQVVKVWSVQSRNEIRSFRGHSDWVTSIAFSADGSSIVSASLDSRVLLWRFLADDANVAEGHARRVTGLAVAADGQRFVSGSDDRTARLWDLASGVELRVLSGHAGALTAVAIAPDGRSIATAGQDRKIKTWNAATGLEVSAFESRDEVLLLAYTPDSQNIVAWVRRRAVSDDDSTDTIQKFEAATLKPMDAMTDRGRRVTCLSLSADGMWAAMGAADGSVRIWDLGKKERVAGDRALLTKAVWDVALTPDKSTLIAADKDGQIRLTPLAGSGGARSLSSTIRNLDGLQVAPDGQRFAVYGDGRVELRTLPAGDVVRTWPLPGVRSLAFVPKSRTLLAGLDTSIVVALEGP